MGNCCKPNFISSLLGNNVNGALRSTIAQIEALQKCCAKNGDKIDANGVLISKLYNVITPYGTIIDEINTKADTILDKIQNIKITYTGGGDTPMDLTNYLTKDITWKFATNYDTSKTTYTLEDLSLDTINSITSNNAIVTKDCLKNYVASELPYFDVLVAYTSGNTPYWSLNASVKNLPMVTNGNLKTTAGPIVTEQAMIKYFEKSRNALTFRVFGGKNTNEGNELTVSYDKLQKTSDGNNYYALATQDYVDSYYQKKISESCRIAWVGQSEKWFSDEYYVNYSFSDIFGDKYKDSRDKDLINRSYLNKYVEAKALDKTQSYYVLAYDSGVKTPAVPIQKPLTNLLPTTTPTDTDYLLTTKKYVDEKTKSAVYDATACVEVLRDNAFTGDLTSETCYSITYDSDKENYGLTIMPTPGHTLVVMGGINADITTFRVIPKQESAKLCEAELSTTFTLVVEEDDFTISAGSFSNTSNVDASALFTDSTESKIAKGTYVFDFSTQSFGLGNSTLTTLLKESSNSVEVVEGEVEVIDSDLFMHKNYSETEDETVTKTTYSLAWDNNLENFRMLNIKIIPGYTLVLAGCGSSDDIQHLTFSTDYTLAKTAGFRDTTFKLVVPSYFYLSSNVNKDEDILQSINGVPNDMFYNLGSSPAYIAPGTYIFDFNTQRFKKEINEDYLNNNYILNDAVASIETTDGITEGALSAISEYTLITSEAVDAKIENAGPVNVATFSNDTIELEDLTVNNNGGFDLNCVPGKTYIFDGNALYESLGGSSQIPIVVKPMSKSYTKAGIKAMLVFIYNEKIQFELTGVGTYASILNGTVTSDTVVELNGISSAATLVSGTIES